MTNVRVLLCQLLAPELPDTWALFDHGVTLENPLQPVVVVRQTAVNRFDQAPRLYRAAGFTVGLVEPGLDVDALEDDLDADLEKLLDALEAIDMPGLVWDDAQRVTFDNRFHGYDVHLTITTEKD